MRYLFLLPLLACGETDPPPASESEDTAAEGVESVVVTVTLDGAPVRAMVQINDGVQVHTNDQGQITLPGTIGDTAIAAHPDARIRGREISGPDVSIALERFDRSDNTDYVFQPPGVPGDLGTTAECGHCHQGQVTDWAASPHRTSASNVHVQELYSGTVALNAADCASSGGTWTTGPLPGGGTGEQCYAADGVLQLLNTCDGPCDDATAFGACADCHAPGIDGELGGRSLHDAQGLSYTEGVHCDVCHKVESVDLNQPAGVAGALHIVRPSEPDSFSEWQYLTFGPWSDVSNPRMGSVQRDHFYEASFCAGCHQLDQESLIPGADVDPARWSDGTFPVHSTFEEWQNGPYSPASPCQSCHMPPENRYLNAADLTDPELADAAFGWLRPPGSVRRHQWPGPRTRAQLLKQAASLDVDVTPGQQTTVSVTTTNSGCGHALPTGDPLRSVILVVSATCDGAPLAPIGGDVVPSFGGALDAKPTGWDNWAGAAVGEYIRVIRYGGWRDPRGPEPFDTQFTAVQKGLRFETYVDQAQIIAVNGDAVTLDHALAAGDMAYRVNGAGELSEGPSMAWAGAPGYAFARVLSDGVNDMVPHYRANDARIDNRLMPLDSVTTTHQFGSCDDPEVTARLVHRPFPISSERPGWVLEDQLIVEVTK